MAYYQANQKKLKLLKKKATYRIVNECKYNEIQTFGKGRQKY